MSVPNKKVTLNIRGLPNNLLKAICGSFNPPNRPFPLLSLAEIPQGYKEEIF